MSERRRRSEEGSALFVAVLMLVMMGFLGVAALDSASRDREVAGAQNRSRTAFYAAEAGLANARQLVHAPTFNRTSPPPVGFPTQAAPTNISDVSLYDREFGALPNFYGDPNPTAPDPCAGGPMCFWKAGPPAARQAGTSARTGPMRIWDLYRVNVIGESPDGSRSRVEAVEAKLATGGLPGGGTIYGGG